jgi:parallel beta-helix repeat protein
VSLDCKGYKIGGNGTGYGVYAYGSNNDIADCVINNFYDGIFISQANNSYIENNSVTNSAYAGIVNGWESNNTYIIGNILNSNYWAGVFCQGSHYNTSLINNTANSNSLYGFYLTNNNLVKNNTLSSNGYSGLYLVSSSKSTVANNTITNSGSYGIRMLDVSNNTIRDNIIQFNPTGIIYETSTASNYNLVFNNFFRNTVNAYNTWTNYWNTSEGVTTATTTTGTINPATSEQRIVSIVTGETVATSPVTTQIPVKEVMFKFTVQATQQDDSRVSGSDGAILFVRYVETPQPPPFPETEKIDIELRNGWNLISAPGYGYFSLGTCSASTKPIAFIYLTDQKRYVSFDEALSIMGTDKIKEYLSTHSFWVYSYESCKMTFDVEKYSTYSGLQLDQGWNLLGVTKDMVGETMSNIKGTCTFEKLYNWNADSQQWVAKTENDLIENMGYGGIVKVTSTCNLNTNVIQPPMPS